MINNRFHKQSTVKANVITQKWHLTFTLILSCLLVLRLQCFWCASAEDITGFRPLSLNAGLNVDTAPFARNPHLRTAVGALPRTPWRWPSLGLGRTTNSPPRRFHPKHPPRHPRPVGKSRLRKRREAAARLHPQHLHPPNFRGQSRLSSRLQRHPVGLPAIANDMSANTRNWSRLASLCSKSAIAPLARAGALGSPLSRPNDRGRLGHESLTSLAKVNRPALRRGRSAWALYMCWLWCASAAVIPARASEVVGSRPLVLNAGPNVISAPFARAPHYRGSVEVITSNTVVVGYPGAWSTNQFAPRDGFNQSILLVTRDQSENPGCEGDWWPVLAHTNGTFTLNTRGEDLGAVLAVGDQVELRPLTSVQDLFGSGSELRLLPDSNGLPRDAEEDSLAFLVRSGDGRNLQAGGRIFWHDGSLRSAGWYRGTTRVGDGTGATITFEPGAAFAFYRKRGASPLELVMSGRVHEERLSRYLLPGINLFGTPYPVNLALPEAGLRREAWNSDTNLVAETAVEDVLRPLVGFAPGASYFYHDGTRVGQGWYSRSGSGANVQLRPGAGYLLYLAGSEPRTWRMASPIR